MFEDLIRDRGLSFERLYALLRLNECGSLIEAAGKDEGKQSRYSHYLSELSAFFRVPLTARSGKVIRLTPEGKELAAIVQEYFHALLQFRQQIRNEARLFRFGAADELLQWLVIPTIGSLRRKENPFELRLESLRTTEILSKLQAQQLDFGLVTEVVPATLHRASVCMVKYAVIVPERLVPQRGMINLQRALLDCPHAAVTGDQQISERVAKLAENLKGNFRPELNCDSVAQCVTAVRSGYYAAVIPIQSWTPDSHLRYHVVEGAALDALNQAIVLVWHPRLMEIRGPAARRLKDTLLSSLRLRGSS